MSNKEGKLVFILSPEKPRPTFETFYARVGGYLGGAGPVCVIKPSGEVRMFDTGTIPEVQTILMDAPYHLTHREASYVYDREANRPASGQLVGPMTLPSVFCPDCGGWEVPFFDQIADHEGHIRCTACGGYLLLVQTSETNVNHR